MRDPGGELAQGGHLLGLDQVRLRRLQLSERVLGSVARDTDLFLRALPLGDVAVDRDEAAARHRVDADFENAPIGAHPLDALTLADHLFITRPFGLEIDGAELAALNEKSDPVAIGAGLREQRIWDIEDFLKVAVPGDELLLAVEHRDAVAHVVERHAQFRLASRQLLRAIT